MSPGTLSASAAQAAQHMARACSGALMDLPSTVRRKPTLNFRLPVATCARRPTMVRFSAALASYFSLCWHNDQRRGSSPLTQQEARAPLLSSTLSTLAAPRPPPRAPIAPVLAHEHFVGCERTCLRVRWCRNRHSRAVGGLSTRPAPAVQRLSEFSAHRLSARFHALPRPLRGRVALPRRLRPL